MEEQLIRGECPICKKIIMDKRKMSYINGGMEFWVQFNDKSRATFSICEDCYKTLTQEQLDEIMRFQIVSWGVEISQTLIWFYRKAVHLKIVKHARTKDAIQTTS